MKTESNMVVLSWYIFASCREIKTRHFLADLDAEKRRAMVVLKKIPHVIPHNVVRTLLSKNFLFLWKILLSNRIRQAFVSLF